MAVDLAVLLVFLALLGATRCYLAFRENRSLSRLYQRLRQMRHEQEMKEQALARARQEFEQGKLQLSLEA